MLREKRVRELALADPGRETFMMQRKSYKTNGGDGNTCRQKCGARTWVRTR
jgi:hypothetical protein